MNNKTNWVKWLLILIGTITWSWTMVKSGWLYSYGLGFWGANGHDGIVHIALAEGLSRGSPSMPFFAGSTIQNYHIGFDLLLALLHKITFIPTLNLYFQILPPVLAILIGYLTYVFTTMISNSKKAGLWATFFVYFGGSFGWLIGRGESAFWAQQGISTLINPPFALSLILLLLGLILLFKLDKKFTTLNFILSVIIFGILMEIKSYAGVLALGGILVTAIYSILIYRKTYLLKVFVGSLILAIILYFPLNRNSASLLIFRPFWFLETLMGLPDRLNWTRYYSAMLSYRSGKNLLKGVPAYFIAFILFWIGNMGLRIIKEFTIFKWLTKIKKLKWYEVFMASVIIAGGLIPMLFLQKGTPWNTIQFFYYSLFFSAILVGITLGNFVENTRLNTSILYSIEVAVVLLTIPTTLLTLKDVYIPGRPPAMLLNDELSALTFLSKQPQGVVLTKPFDQSSADAAEGNPPRPLYLYTSTAYVSAFSNHQTFLEDEINLDISGYDWPTRRSQVLGWYDGKDQLARKEFLHQNGISYIYWIKDGGSPPDLGKLGLSNMFENNLVTIYRVE